MGYRFRIGFILALVSLFVVACGTTPASPAAGAPTSVTSPETNTPAGNPAQPTAPAATNTTAATNQAGPTTGAGGAPASGTVTLVVVPDKSKAGYRVREQLAGLSLPSDAVGTTNAITGTILGKMDGSIDSSASKFVVDLRTLQSDQPMRDGFIQRTPLETSQYPYATFVPTSATGLPTALPASGQGSFKLTGNLTIKDVTKPVTWDATCQVQSNQTEATCQATTSFTFEDFNLTQPRVGRVLSIVDKITLEVTVDLQRTGV